MEKPEEKKPKKPRKKKDVPEPPVFKVVPGPVLVEFK
jgi:hypothetical protein